MPKRHGPHAPAVEEDVVVDEVFAPDARFFQLLQILNQVADREICRIALAVVAVFLAKLESSNIRRRHDFALVAQSFQGAVHELFVFPGESSEQEGGLVALIGGKCSLNRLVEVMKFFMLNAGFFF